MKKMIFACPWNNDTNINDKTQSWSGTHWALFQSLKKYYDLYDFDTGFNHNKHTIVKLYWYAIRILRKFHLWNDDMGRGRRKLMNALAKKIPSDNAPIFQFEESPIIEGHKNYIYQDLSAITVNHIRKENPELFKICGFQRTNTEALERREKEQSEFYQQASGIFTMGKWLADYLVKNCNIPAEKVHAVGGGSNMDFSLMQETAKTNSKILFVGRDFERKNGPLVLEAFEMLKKQMPDAELYIAGPDNLEISAGGVYLLGNLPYNQLAHYFNICDIFCMPSKFEAYGLVFIEALAYGLPCIGRNAYEMPYFIEDKKTGYLLNEESPEALAKLMYDLLLNDEIKNNVRKKRDWYINEYSWDSVAQRINSVIGNEGISNLAKKRETELADRPDNRNDQKALDEYFWGE